MCIRDSCYIVDAVSELTMSSDEELPDIPYCPMFRTSVQLEEDVEASCSSSATSSSTDTRDNRISGSVQLKKRHSFRLELKWKLS